MTATAMEQAIDRVQTGQRIRKLRIARRMTLQDLADVAGCTRGHVHNIETGRSRASQTYLTAIADFFGVQADELRRAS